MRFLTGFLAIVFTAFVPFSLAVAAETGQEAVKSLEAARDEATALADAGKPSDAVTAYEKAAKSVVASAGADSDAGQVLTRALASAEKIDDPAARAGRLAIGVQEAIVALTFKPKMEAELPEGFPKPGPVSEVIVKEYPAYRMARTAMSGQNQAFLTLFKHIEGNGIAMSAPVEMGYRRGEKAGAAPEPRTMAFLYGKPTIGAPGKQGDVDVVDVPAITVVSIGVRGSYNDERMADTSKRLDAWLEAHKDQYERAGEPRFLGYNSPFVPPWQQYGEAQVPVKRTAGAGGGAAKGEITAPAGR